MNIKNTHKMFLVDNYKQKFFDYDSIIEGLNYCSHRQMLQFFSFVSVDNSS